MRRLLVRLSTRRCPADKALLKAARRAGIYPHLMEPVAVCPGTPHSHHLTWIGRRRYT